MITFDRSRILNNGEIVGHIFPSSTRPKQWVLGVKGKYFNHKGELANQGNTRKCFKTLKEAKWWAIENLETNN